MKILPMQFRIINVWIIIILILSVHIQQGSTRSENGNIAVMTINYKTNQGENEHITLKIELFEDQFPETVKNFKGFCGTVSIPQSDGNLKAYTYKGTVFHRIIDGFVIQGGDVQHMNGMGGISSLKKWNWGRFPDETDKMKGSGKYPMRLHNKIGMVAMANSGPNTNGCQFYITLSESSCSHLDGRHTVFGEVIYGLDGLMRLVKNRKRGSDLSEDDLPRITEIHLESDLSQESSEFSKKEL
ncbi:hypothetical protein NEIRO03_1750 [Nematocida sp. AWRm78]|nr:hypothetical protein NEIRO03_1750 [Nematocida sp. AWRm78]